MFNVYTTEKNNKKIISFKQLDVDLKDLIKFSVSVKLLHIHQLKIKTSSFLQVFFSGFLLQHNTLIFRSGIKINY